MNLEETQEAFLDFLARAKTWDRYEENAGQSALDRCKSIGYPRGFIGCAFVWEHTPEGAKFWARINTAWIRHLKSNFEQCDVESAT